jgi:hypothetical protein
MIPLKGFGMRSSRNWVKGDIAKQISGGTYVGADHGVGGLRFGRLCQFWSSENGSTTSALA